MAKNFIQRGESVQIVAPAAYTGGTLYLIAAGVVGLALQTAASGALVEVLVEGVIDYSLAAVTVALGDLAYWDNTAKKVTNVSTSNTKIGIFIRAQTSGDPLGRVRLNGAF